MNTFITSIIRTGVPIVVGWVAAALTSVGLNLPQEAFAGLEATLTASFAFGYYLIVRLIERKNPKIGVLLGVSQQPAYSSVGVTQEELQAILDHIKAENAEPAEEDNVPWTLDEEQLD